MKIACRIDRTRRLSCLIRGHLFQKNIWQEKWLWKGYFFDLEEFYHQDKSIELQIGKSALKIDPNQQRVEFSDR